MADPDQIMARIRGYGANVTLDAGRIRIVNGSKLPEGAAAFIKANAKAIAEFIRAEQSEEADRIEHDTQAPREWVEEFVRFCGRSKPAHWSDVDHSWVLSVAGRIIDEAGEIERRAA